MTKRVRIVWAQILDHHHMFQDWNRITKALDIEELAVSKATVQVQKQLDRLKVCRCTSAVCTYCMIVITRKRRCGYASLWTMTPRRCCSMRKIQINDLYLISKTVLTHLYDMQIATCNKLDLSCHHPRLHARCQPPATFFLAPRVASHHRHVQCRIFKWESLFGGDSGPKTSSEEPDPIPYSELPFPADIILEGTFLDGKPLARAYKASQDGWSALAFHDNCDFKGPCVVVATTVNGNRFGGFNPVGWRSTDDYSASFNAFLFFWPAQHAQDSAPVLLRKVGGSEAAIFDYARGGPQWGADGLLIGPPKSPVMGGFAGPEIRREVRWVLVVDVIKANLAQGTAGDLRMAKSRLGLSYEEIPLDYGQTSVFGGGAATAELQEVEVYFCPEIARLY